MIYADDNVHEALEKVAAKLTRTELGLIEKYIASKGVQRVKPRAAQGTLGSRFGNKYQQLSNTGRRKAKTGDWQNLGTKTKVASDDNIHTALEKVAGWGRPSSYSGQDEKYAREFRRKSDMAHGGPMFGQFRKGYQNRLRKYVAARKRGMSAKDAIAKYRYR